MPPTDEQVHRLLFEEAELLDRHEYSAWLELFTDDATYWIPAGQDQLDPERTVSIVYDDRKRLEERVWRLESGGAFAQEPRSRTTRLISNVQVGDRGNDAIAVAAAFLVAEWRRGVQSMYAGRLTYTLRPRGDDVLIASKRVDLINGDAPLGNLSLIF